MSSTLEYLATVNGSSVLLPSDDNESEATSGSAAPEAEREMWWWMLSLSLLIVATAVGNILVCLAVTWERRLQNMTNYFLMSLAIADLLVSLLVMPPAMIVELYGYFPMGPNLCVIWATMDVLLCTASIWHMCTMSMDRYFTIRYPIRYGRNKTRKMMGLKITFVWVISFALSTPLMIAGFVDYNNVYTEGKCVPKLKNFVLYGSIFAFYVPLVIMVTTYMLTTRILRQNRRLMFGTDGKYRQQTGSSSATQVVDSLVNQPEGTTFGPVTRITNGVGLSPPQSGFTITSAGLTSVKCSSAESATSGLNSSPKRRAETLKVALVNEDNYINGGFNQAERKSVNRNGPSHLSAHYRNGSPKGAVNRCRSHPVFSQPTRGDSSPYVARISTRFSDTNLTNHLSRSTHNCQSNPAADDHVRNAVVRCLREDTGNGNTATGSGCARSYCSLGNDHPVSFRLATSASAENVVYNVVYRPSRDFSNRFVCRRTDDVFREKMASCKTAQMRTPSRPTTQLTRASSGPCPFNVNQPCHVTSGQGDASLAIGHNEVIRKLSNARTEKPEVNSGRTEKPEMNSGRTEKPEVNSDGATSDGGTLTTRLIANGGPDGPPEVVPDPGNADRKDDNQRLKILTHRDFYRRIFPGPWTRRTPASDATTPSRSETRTFLKSRIVTRRNRKSSSACARKIGLSSKSRSTNEEKASKVLGIIFAVFVISWTPFFAMNIISVVCETCMESVSLSAESSVLWLGYLSSLANPIIYTMFSTSFRTVFYRILTCQYSNAMGCGPPSRLTPSDDRNLCWSRTGRSSCLKDVGGI